MKDGDHLAEQHGYSSPMQALLSALLLQTLSDPDAAVAMLGIELTQQDRLQATTPQATRLLILSKLQERF